MPSLAAAQTPPRRIGWIELSASSDKYAAFGQEIAGIGLFDGQAPSLVYRSGDGGLESLSAVAAELARIPVDVLVAPGVAEALAAKNATKSLPIVMAGVDDPVARGLVSSLAKPGRNVTGIARVGRDLYAACSR